MDSSSSRLDNEGKVESLYTHIPNDDALTHQDGPQIFWINVGETIEESKETMTFSSDKELNDKEDNVLLLKMIDGDEKVEEPKPSMTVS
jgi:hypothetical protein